MTALAGTEHCAIDSDHQGRQARAPRGVLPALLGALLMGPLGSTFLWAAPAPEPSPEAQAAHQVTQPEGLRARLLGDEASPVRRLDAAIFTELLPVTASEPAVRLPDDQRESQ